MAQRAQQVIKVVATIRQAGTDAAALQMGLAAETVTLEAAIRARLGLEFGEVTLAFKPKISVLGSNVYQLYPKVHISGNTDLERSAWGVRWNGVRDEIVGVLTTHMAAIGATLQAMYTKEYDRV